MSNEILIKSNFSDTHQRSPSWVVAFIRFKQPASMYTKKGVDNFATKPLLVVTNDCVGISVSNPKGSFAKTCSLSMKPTDFWFTHGISTGDWVFVWMHDDPAKTEFIKEKLKTLSPTTGSDLCNYESGLKFVGRVIDLDENDSIAPNGMRMVSQTVNCQAFLEFATSVYYTFVSNLKYDLNNTPSNQGAATANLFNVATEGIISGRVSGLPEFLGNLAQKFYDYYRTNTDRSPDTIISLFFILIMGIEKNNIFNDKKVAGGNKGLISRTIYIPKEVSWILGLPRGDRLYELFNVITGLQKYDQNGKTPAEILTPVISESESDAIFKRTPTRTDGFVPFVPVNWNNVTLWSILSSYLNPIVNEMYTCLRLNSENRLVPTLVIREKPFSTGLYHHLSNDQDTVKDMSVASKDIDAKNFTLGDKRKQKILNNTSKEKLDQNIITEPSVSPGEENKRTLFKELPIWKIDESMISNVSVRISEQNRVNFVQVWGRMSDPAFFNIQVDQEAWKRQQFLSGNYFIDDDDVQRHGLRAFIQESPFDVYSNETAEKKAGSRSYIWARKNADWLFNGHLKTFGSITLNGVVEPICEGDNCLVRGILYHIDSVSHSAQLSPTGQKSFVTVLSVSNGTVFASLSDKDPPQYPIHLGAKRPKTTVSSSSEVEKKSADSSDFTKAIKNRLKV